MDLDTLAQLRKSHPAWRLLVADHATLIAAFVARVFLEPNVRSLPEPDAVSALDDLLFQVRDRADGNPFPRPASDYIEAWASEGHRWLRRYYVHGDDTPQVDVTPATEKAVRWLTGLAESGFVGTESRLLTIVELLRQIASGTETDAEVRVKELLEKRRQIDDEIARVRGGDFELMDDVRVKERFLQMRALALELLSDFRQVEENFRQLDRAVRERVATWDEGKGALLDDVLGDRDAIADSEQGRSFRAFWDFLMSPRRQRELTELLDKALALDAVLGLRPDSRARKVHHDWLEAGDVAQQTVARLSAQLRKFLDDQAWQEDRRILKLVRGIEQRALAVRDSSPVDAIMEIDARRPTLRLPLERPLHVQRSEQALAATAVLAGAEEDVAADVLFSLRHVDLAKLDAHIDRALAAAEQVSLRELTEQHPLEHGLAELVAYFQLASTDRRAHIDDDVSDELHWVDDRGAPRVATTPRVLFSRR